MKTIILLCAIAVVSAVYTDVDETIDIDGMMLSGEKLKPYMDCYLDRGPCSKSAASYKTHIIDFLSNACKDCDDKLKHIIEEFLLNAMTNNPDDVAQLRAKYDPTGANFSKLVYSVSKYRK